MSEQDYAQGREVLARVAIAGQKFDTDQFVALAGVLSFMAFVLHVQHKIVPIAFLTGGLTTPKLVSGESPAFMSLVCFFMILDGLQKV